MLPTIIVWLIITIVRVHILSFLSLIMVSSVNDIVCNIFRISMLFWCAEIGWTSWFKIEYWAFVSFVCFERKLFRSVKSFQSRRDSRKSSLCSSGPSSFFVINEPVVYEADHWCLELTPRCWYPSFFRKHVKQF